MANDLEALKAKLWDQFNKACEIADHPYLSEGEANRNAAGGIALAIVAIEKELRERAETAKPPLLEKSVLRPAN